jgi:hypothetical protein
LPLEWEGRGWPWRYQTHDRGSSETFRQGIYPGHDYLVVMKKGRMVLSRKVVMRCLLTRERDLGLLVGEKENTEETGEFISLGERRSPLSQTLSVFARKGLSRTEGKRVPNA